MLFPRYRILGRDKNEPWTERDWRIEFKRLRAAIAPDLEGLGFGDLHAQDLQSCLCAFDKYLRVKQGEGKPRRRFRPSSEPLPESKLSPHRDPGR
jgi:hypothetical protein